MSCGHGCTYTSYSNKGWDDDFNKAYIIQVPQTLLCSMMIVDLTHATVAFHKTKKLGIKQTVPGTVTFLDYMWVHDNVLCYKYVHDGNSGFVTSLPKLMRGKKRQSP